MLSSGRNGSNGMLTTDERGAGAQYAGRRHTDLPGGGGTSPGHPSVRRSAWVVAGFLAGFTPFNLYWGFGGEWGVRWVVGCEDCLPLLAVWVQQVALIGGIVIVLGRAGIWLPPLPNWVLRVGAWGMAVSFGAAALQNLLWDNRLQARLLFAPVAAVMCALTVLVARAPDGTENDDTAAK